MPLRSSLDDGNGTVNGTVKGTVDGTVNGTGNGNDRCVELLLFLYLSHHEKYQTC